MSKIIARNFYWAAPLHEEEERQATDERVKQLRDSGISGIQVYVPHEHGVWEEMVEEQCKLGFSYQEAVKIVKQKIYLENLRAMDEANAIIVYVARRPSEGQTAELGYFVGTRGEVYIINEVDWPLNLMLEYGANKMYRSIAEFLDDLR
jgi:nucleoside 2-deoxyribosyltransferase